VHTGMFEAGERRPEVVEPMIERLAYDGNALMSVKSDGPNRASQRLPARSSQLRVSNRLPLTHTRYTRR
jgi:hypothetical protein